MPSPIQAATSRLAIMALVAAAVFGPGAAMAQQGPAEREAMQVCRADYEALCAGVPPGGGRILACLQQHVDKLSAGCKQALASLKTK